MMSGIPENTHQGKEESRKQEAETKSENTKSNITVSMDTIITIIKVMITFPATLFSRDSMLSRYLITTLTTATEVAKSAFLTKMHVLASHQVSHALSLKDQLRIIRSNLNMYTYGNDRPPFDDEYHPNKVLKDLLELLKEDKWTLDMIKANGGELLVIDLLRVFPKIIETNNIEEDTANEDDKDVLLKQTELVEDLIKAICLLLLNQPLGKVLIDYLTNDNYLSQLFTEDGRKQGYKSKHLKNKFSSGVFFSLFDFLTTHSSTIEDVDKNKVIKLLEKLSSNIDAKRFGEMGGLSEVSDLLQSNPNEDNTQSLWYIVHDMWKAQGYDRE